MSTIDDERQELTVEANAAREKLLHTVEALDRRRHDAMDIKLQVRRHALPLGVGAGIIALGILGGVAVIVHRITHHAERRRHERWAMFGRVWRHPERAAKTSPPFWKQVARTIAMGLVTTGAMIPLKRLLSRTIEPLVDKTIAPTPRLRVGDAAIVVKEGHEPIEGVLVDPHVSRR